MKRFYLQRNQDASGVSGLGKVAEGCEFDTGWCALIWLTGKAAMSYYPDIATLESIHGHGGMTKVVWVDDESSNVVIQREQGGGNRALVTIGETMASNPGILQRIMAVFTDRRKVPTRRGQFTR